MIEIIPLNEASVSEAIHNLSHKDVYVTSLNLISNLLSRDNYPLKDNKKSIRHILDFLSYSDKKMYIDKTSILSFHSNLLNSFFDMKHRTKYLDILKEMNVMTRVPYEDGTFYVQGKTSSLYRFHNEYRFSDLAIVIIHSNKNEISIQTKVDKKFSNAIRFSTINYPEAIKAEIEYCKSQTDKDFTEEIKYRMSNLFSSHSNRYISKGTNVDRIYHSFSNLSRVSREFLSVENMSYFNIDIVNCQPMLLCYYLKANNLEFDETYINDCESGMLYEKFEGTTGKFTVKVNGNYFKQFKSFDNIKKHRSEIKVELYKSVYFMFDTTSPMNQKFKELYPITWNTLNKISTEKTMASILQNIEASIFNTLRPRHSKYYFTLFDAIYFTDINDKEILVEEIKSKFEKLNLNPTIK